MLQDSIYSTSEELIVEGSHGRVFKGWNTKDEKPVAVKVLYYVSQAEKDKLILESNIMQCLDSLYVIKCFDIEIFTYEVRFFIEYCKDGDLKNFIQKQGPIPQGKAVSILRDLVSGFRELHAKNIIHRDMKPQNILISDGVFKIAGNNKRYEDFGSACVVTNYEETIPYSERLGTPAYSSPQILNEQDHSSKTDIWSLGVIIVEALLGKLPWQQLENKYILFQEISGLDIDFTQIPASQELLDLLKRMLVKEESGRISQQQLFNHPIIVIDGSHTQNFDALQPDR